MSFRQVHIILMLSGMMLLCGCANRPDNVLSQQKMEDLMVDIHKAEAVIDMNSARFCRRFCQENNEAIDFPQAWCHAGAI